MPTPKTTVDQKRERIKKQCEKAERGQDGLKRITSFDFFTLTNSQRKELLTEPFVITSYEEDMYVMMTVEQYFAFRPLRSIPGRQPKMVRLEGVLYRECI